MMLNLLKTKSQIATQNSLSYLSQSANSTIKPEYLSMVICKANLSLIKMFKLTNTYPSCAVIGQALGRWQWLWLWLWLATAPALQRSCGVGPAIPHVGFLTTKAQNMALLSSVNLLLVTTSRKRHMGELNHINTSNFRTSHESSS